MPKKKTREQFIKEAVDIHGDKYDYSQVEYINTHTKVIVICPNHGEILVRPNDHVKKKSGCPHCAGLAKGTAEKFIEQAIEVHGDKYDYSLVKYNGTHQKVTIICPEHGRFEMTPTAHISQQQNCVKCSYIDRGNNKRKSTEQFIEDAIVVHGDKYDYSLVNYNRGKAKVNIICIDHGVFQQTPDNHINSKQGCPICWDERRPPGVGGYHQGYFNLNPDKKTVPAIFYALEIESLTTKDHFIKIGITSRSIKERYAKSGCGDKYLQKTTISEIQLPLYDAWKLEQRLLTELTEYQYFPNIDFDGKTECFKPKYEVFKQINSI